MKYVIAFDGGGTKTRCIVGDFLGHIVADCSLGASNHQIVGPEETRNVLENLKKTALEIANLSDKDISMAFLGLAGADLASDFEILEKLCSDIFKGIPFKVVNDAWIAMRSGLRFPWGAVAICGTGANSGVRHPDGRYLIQRALSYTLGSYGGGTDIATTALHHAFKSEEGTGEKTLLEKYIPKALGLSTMPELLEMLYPENRIPSENYAKISPLVFNLATKGDRVSQDILITMGTTMGEMLAGLIKRMEIEHLQVPVVIAGSVFSGNNPLLLDSFILALHRTVPDAYLVKPSLPPVAGAYLCALDEVLAICSDDLYERLSNEF